MPARPCTSPPCPGSTRHRRSPFRRLRFALGATLALASPIVSAAGADGLDGGWQGHEQTPAGPLWLRLRGGIERNSEPRERLFGVLELGVGLDVLGAGRASALAASASEAKTSAGPVSEASPLGARSPVAAPSESLRRPLELTSAVARATLAAATRVWDAAAAPARLDSLLSRSRSSASLPEVRLAAGSSRDQSLRLTPTISDPAKFTQDGGRDLWFEARLTWRLEHVLFSHDEIAIERLKAQALESRRLLVRQVLEALLGWQRARQALGSDRLSEEERNSAELRELDAVLRLDAWTDGWFSRHLERARAADFSDWRPSLD